jgi:DNA-binding CsgD family transcriptional regulator
MVCIGGGPKTVHASARAASSGKTAQALASASRVRGAVKQAPTERDRAIAQRRTEGRTFQRIGREFDVTPETARSICRRVEDYDRGAALLRNNPASIEALGLIGEVKPSVQQALRSRGIERLTELEGVTLDQLLSWPNVGRQSATALLDALARMKKPE